MSYLPHIICIVGPTATGKSDYAVALAQALIARKTPVAIVSADSRQVYRGLDLGSGKILASEMQGVPHYMLDVADPSTTYTAGDFARDASRIIDTLIQQGVTPIVCGGSGFYIDTLVYNMLPPTIPPNNELRRQLASLDTEELFAKLASVAPRRAETIDRHNPVRLIRALEMHQALGAIPPQDKTPRYTVTWIGLSLPLPILKERIHNRLINRIQQGMIQEVSLLQQNRLSWDRLDTLGLEYRYIAQHLQGMLTHDELLQTLETKIVQYAKRQLTWFKKNPAIIWRTPPFDEIVLGDIL